MAWNDPNDAPWDVGDVITSDSLKDYVRDNLLALKYPASGQYEADESSNYSTSSSSFVNVDGSDTEGKFKQTLVTNGGDVMVHFDGNLRGTGGSVYLDVKVDDNRLGGNEGILGSIGTTLLPGFPMSFTRIISGLPAGEHVFRLQWRVGAGTGLLYAGAGTTDADIIPQFWVREVS